MLHLLVWVPVLVLLAAWSALCWAAGTLVNAVDGPNGLGGGWVRWLEAWQIPAAWADWLPMHSITAFKVWLTTLGVALQDWLSQAPDLAAWLAPLIWAVWLLGALGLGLMGVVGSVVIAALRPSSATPATPGR